MRRAAWSARGERSAQVLILCALWLYLTRGRGEWSYDRNCALGARLIQPTQHNKAYEDASIPGGKSSTSVALMSRKQDAKPSHRRDVSGCSLGDLGSSC